MSCKKDENKQKEAGIVPLKPIKYIVTKETREEKLNEAVKT